MMLAYETECALCALAHRELLDAAHIVPDSDPLGLPVIQTAQHYARSTTASGCGNYLEPALNAQIPTVSNGRYREFQAA